MEKVHNFFFLFHLFNGELAVISKSSLTKFEVHRMKGLREITERNFSLQKTLLKDLSNKRS